MISRDNEDLIRHACTYKPGGLKVIRIFSCFILKLRIRKHVQFKESVVYTSSIAKLNRHIRSEVRKKSFRFDLKIFPTKRIRIHTVYIKIGALKYSLRLKYRDRHYICIYEDMQWTVFLTTTAHT